LNLLQAKAQKRRFSKKSKKQNCGGNMNHCLVCKYSMELSSFVEKIGIDTPRGRSTRYKCANCGAEQVITQILTSEPTRVGFQTNKPHSDNLKQVKQA
jgi:hypothetical protein